MVHHNLFTFGNSDTDTDIIAENTKFMDRKFFQIFFLNFLKKQFRKGFGPLGSKSKDFFEKLLGKFLDFVGEFFGGFFGRMFWGGFFGRIFWEEFLHC